MDRSEKIEKICFIGYTPKSGTRNFEIDKIQSELETYHRM